jgi:hypothetical protein
MYFTYCTGMGSLRPKRSFHAVISLALSCTTAPCSLRRVIMAVIGSPGTRWGMMKMRVALSQTVKMNRLRRRIR